MLGSGKLMSMMGLMLVALVCMFSAKDPDEEVGSSNADNRIVCSIFVSVSKASVLGDAGLVPFDEGTVTLD